MKADRRLQDTTNEAVVAHQVPGGRDRADSHIRRVNSFGQPVGGFLTRIYS